VRIWNIARTQTQIRQYMNQPLPNPSTQTGLLAYYTFDNLKNKQGNSQWDGSLLGNAAINQTNPTCSSFIADSCNVKPVSVIATFTGPDTVCNNTLVQFINTSINASNYYWSFCTAGFNTTPAAQNLGNSGNLLKTPVFMDYALDDDGNYYGFISNYDNGHIIKLNYGNSLLNTPTATDLGNFGMIPIYAEGIQAKKVNGKCYVFAVAAGDAQGSKSALFRLDFGSSFANTPIATNLGNVGNLLFPHDLFITQEGNNFYGFTISINNNTITRFDFGNSLDNQPTGTNLGSIGNMNYPCGFSFINNNGNWYAFVTNRDNNSITRLSFGASLTNKPTGANIGNPANFLNRPRDISIFESCEGVVGLVVNEENEQTGTITKLNFGDNLLSKPQAKNLGNVGELKFPHSISKFFLEGNDIYCFITNVKNNSITRLRYTGCTSTNISSSTQQTPPAVSYSEPGMYNVNLLVDIGLPTQTSFCKQIVVKNCDTICNLNAGFTYKQNTCDPKTIQFNDKTSNADSIWWNFGDGKTTGNVQNPNHQYASFNNYRVQMFAKTNSGCLDTAIININVSIKKDSAIINRDTSICAKTSLQLSAVKGISYCWSPSIGLSDSTIQNPVATPKVTTKYYLHILTANNQPVAVDSVTVNIIPPPVVNAGNDVSVCKGSSVQLNASGAINFNWNTSKLLSDTTIANPLASPLNTTSFIVKGFDGKGCWNTDTVKVSVLSLPVITLANDTGICKGGSVLLQATQSNYKTYSWYPLGGLSVTNANNTIAGPTDTTKYFVTVSDNNNCTSTDSITINVLPKPEVTAMSDTSICKGNSITLKTTAAHASIFSWQPQTGLNDSYIQNPNATPASSTTYTVTAGNGICSEKASVLISILPSPEVIASNDTTVCGNASAKLNATGAESYTWFPATGLSDATISNPVATPGATTTYYVKGTANNSCTNIDSVTININPPPTFIIQPQNASVCFGDSVRLTASGGDIYDWSPAETLTNATSANTQAHPLQDTKYTVTITNSVCKVSNILTSAVAVKDLPVVTINKSNDVDCINFEAQLTSTGGTSYRWLPANYISNIYVSNPLVYPPADTKYFVTVRGENGCTSKDSILVKSTNANAGDARFEIPNAFTPNHDGINDCFGVHYWGTADVFSISIYNRWGQLVFYSKDLSSCWDGAYKDVPQPAGTYIYIINISSRCTNGLVQKKGTVTLIR
jgi:gliding motility-associated-like protein